MDIDLSRDEDSVTSLAVAAGSTTDSSSSSNIIAFAGINSSETDQKAGRNEHLRCFRLHHPPARPVGDPTDVPTQERAAAPSSYNGKTEALGRSSLFTSSSSIKKETYQRVLRLLRTTSENGPQMGAIATGLAPQGEIVVFDASKTPPRPSDVVQRINLGDGKEAADLDLIRASNEEYRLAYCTDYDVHVVKLDLRGPKQSSEPEFLHGTPHPDTFASTKARPKFRSLRFLTPTLILLLQNKPDRQGAELLLLEIPKFAILGMIVLRKRLPKSVKVATALSTALLPASSPSNSAQHVIAVAGQDNSITILTIDHPSSPPYGSLAFSLHATLPSVHPLQMTSLTFSTVNPPDPSSPSPSQYLKLASTSVAKTVVVHTLPLTLTPQSAPTPAGQRYVLRAPGRSEAAQITLSLIVSALVIALGAFFLQAFTEIRGGTPEYLGAKGWLSERLHGYIARPYMFDDLPATIPHVPTHSVKTAVSKAIEFTEEKLSLRHLLSQRKSRSGDQDNSEAPTTDVIVVTPHGDGTALSVDVRDPATVVKDTITGKKWEEMEEAEREGWKRRLIEAGEWAVEEGENVLKGVFFSGLGGLVGERVMDVLGS